MMPGFGMMSWGLGGLGMAMGGLFTLVWWGLIIFGVVLAVRWLRKDARGAQHGTSANAALEILKERYARGEIGREEFQAKKQDLAA